MPMSVQWFTEIRDEKVSEHPNYKEDIHRWSSSAIHANLRGQRFSRLERMAKVVAGNFSLELQEYNNPRRGERQLYLNGEVASLMRAVNNSVVSFPYRPGPIYVDSFPRHARWRVDLMSNIAHVRSEMEDLVRKQVSSAVRNEVEAAFPMLARADAAIRGLQTDWRFQPAAIAYGYLNLAHWTILDYYSRCGVYFTQHQLNIMRAMVGIATHSSIWWYNQDNRITMTLARPALKFDPQGRLHSETGPSIDFGATRLKLYAWRGVIVPSKWFTDPKSLTAKVALGCRNTEVRRAACDKLGWSHILKELGGRILDKNYSPEIGTLVEVQIDGMPERFLQVRCGTGREFALPVPRNMRSALEANAWTYGLSRGDFRIPEVRS